ncbi:3-hydroxyacyl-CoA dehydrogenase/enoyl-CoA hydratase family protein [Rickettsia endosymbiont of Halotydeus destructor]|uniref:3-hydroxyacyl-CoA dehydrogenase/enoyl-CoA hydratase family protein n=1 Tax=Rickettsia endosymbiont of Halotydeus destructor TaxID=2996754 RepID=UPI003BAFEB61
MQNDIQKICVIGSGVMGAGIAALIANASHKVVLLDIASKDSDDKNKIVKNAIENLHKQKPPALSFPDKANLITIGNLEDDLNLIKDCDLVIEVIIEKLEIKHQLYDKITPYLKNNAIIASNTSTLPLKRLKENLSSELKSRFVITHFFNPPRYMELLELITDHEVVPKIINQVSEFLTRILGKTIVKCNDTPGFIANRIGCFLLELVVRKAIKANLDPVIIDKIFTTQFGLPGTGIFGLYDLIGHDVMKLISGSLLASLPENDYYHKIYLNTPILDRMIENKLIGRKGGGGFYRLSLIEGKKIKEVINLTDLSYKPVQKVANEFADVNELLTSESIYRKFFAEVITEFYVYLTSLIPEVTSNIYDIDLAMKLGYSWKFGPFELLTFHIKEGWEWLTSQANIMRLPLPDYLVKAEYKNIDKEKFSLRKDIVKISEIVAENDSAKLLLYQNQLVFVINTKMNCLNKEVFYLLQKAIEIAENKEQNLYIWPQGNNFSAGADLKLILSHIENQDFQGLEEFLKLGQQTMLKLKYSSVHVISCAFGIALGGGCELLLHSSFVVANQELNAGLVEVSVGLIPGWGGVTEMLLRSEGDKDKLVKNIKNILTSNKSSSADYFAADYNITHLQINMNKNYILDEALQLQLPKKIILSAGKITLPKIALANELDTSKYNDIQNKILSRLQDFINNHSEINEEEVLSFEREIFLELAKDPKVIDKLRSV